jgi:hypothetical protein
MRCDPIADGRATDADRLLRAVKGRSRDQVVVTRDSTLILVFGEIAAENFSMSRIPPTCGYEGCGHVRYYILAATRRGWPSKSVSSLNEGLSGSHTQNAKERKLTKESVGSQASVCLES